MSTRFMVAPKHKAAAYQDRESVIDAFNEIGKIRPDKNKIIFLINLFNEVHNNNALNWNSYATCGDCQRALCNFFKHVINEWR